MGLISSCCPKCGGPFALQQYFGEGYADCVQCGYLWFLKGDPRVLTDKPGQGSSEVRNDGAAVSSFDGPAIKPIREGRPAARSARKPRDLQSARGRSGTRRSYAAR